jgi:hypothetical protein
MDLQRKVRFVLKAKKNNVPLFLACCKGMYAAITAHQADYAAAPVTMATFLSQIQSVDNAQQGIRNRTVTAAARNQLRDTLFTSAETLRVFVQGLGDASPEQAVTLAQNAGMKTAAVPVRAKPVLGVKQGPHSGIVVLSANARLLRKNKGRMFFNWAYSADGGKTWIQVPSTPTSKTTIAGLQALTTYEFRVSITDKTGQAEWSQVVSFLVH